MAYSSPTAPADSGPARYPATTAGHIVELIDHYQYDHGRWRIAHRNVDMVLAPAAARRRPC
ncbi:hypothetical protein ACIQ6K_38310 [Streptomyces sp. NPDC096354]|uniref:hypothetical protein n=1 Tax=Streptomyces sp. NPDC096354 TaxID=3366088 RepID=UPI0038056BDF